MVHLKCTFWKWVKEEEAIKLEVNSGANFNYNFTLFNAIRILNVKCKMCIIMFHEDYIFWLPTTVIYMTCTAHTMAYIQWIIQHQFTDNDYEERKSFKLMNINIKKKSMNKILSTTPPNFSFVPLMNKVLCHIRASRAYLYGLAWYGMVRRRYYLGYTHYCHCHIIL